MSNYELWQLATYGNILPITDTLFSDERPQSEIDQERFEQAQQSYEFEMQQY